MRSRLVSEFMAGKGATLAPHASLAEAMRALLHHKISSAPVVERDGTLLGILTETDCLRVLLAEALDGIPEAEVHTFMTRDVETVTPETTLYDVVSLLTRHPYRCVPVVENGHLVGRISRADALHAIESMRDDPRLYGQPGAELPDDEQPGVDSAMRRARGC